MDCGICKFVHVLIGGNQGLQRDSGFNFSYFVFHRDIINEKSQDSLHLLENSAPKYVLAAGNSACLLQRIRFFYFAFCTILKNHRYGKQASTVMEIAGKRVLVTGAGKRLGRFIALSLADCGADVVIHYRNSREQAMTLRQDIFARGCHSWLSEHDLAEVEKTESWFADIEKKTGGIDILINSASEYTEIDYDSMSAGDLNRSMSIHVQSPLVMIRAMNRRMKEEKKRGAVINILDSVPENQRHAAYHLGKTALHRLTRDLALRMARVLRINAVAPGKILLPDSKETNRFNQLPPDPGAVSNPAGITGASNPLGLRGKPRYISDAVIYLLRADFVTGMVLHVDGGLHLKPDKL